MGNNATEVVQVPKNPSDVKAHSSICWELIKILDIIGCILPAIESARPGCTSGIKELCSLNTTIEKAKLLLQNCAESSILYMAITSEATLQRCERIRIGLDQSLYQIQNMVPQLLAAQISDVLSYLREAKFVIDSTEEEAGNIMLELLRQTDSSEELEFEAFHRAAIRLNITSPRALLIERRSIQKLLDKIHGNDSKKERILRYFMHLIKKYGKKVRPEGNEQKENAPSVLESTECKCNASLVETNIEPTDRGEARVSLSSSNIPPEEFCCPISSKVMYDPVVIVSGQTYERTCIEKWFGEGHDTCPKTHKKLESHSIIPNTCMKDLISNWCREHGLGTQDLHLQPNLTTCRSWEHSDCSSILSLKNVSASLLYGNAEDNILNNDNSSISFLSSDASYSSVSSHFKGIKSSDSAEDSHHQIFPWSDDYQNCPSFSDFSHDMFLRFFYRLSELPLEHQDRAVKDLKILLEDDEETCYAMLAHDFAGALMKLLENTKDQSDVQAQKIGAQILLLFLSNNGVEIASLREDAFQLLTSFLDSDIITEALMIMQKLAHHQNLISYISASGLPPQLTKVLNSEDTLSVELAVRILHDLSFHSEIRSHILSSGCISRLVSLLSEKNHLEFCIEIMRNLCNSEEAARTIAETDGCFASISEVLEVGTHNEQEHAVVILHSLCSCSHEYCQLVLKEGVIPSLVDISVNGNPKGKESSMKLLNLLRNLRRNDCCESLQPESGCTTKSKSKEDFNNLSTKSETTSKYSHFFGRKMRFFSKPRSVALS